MPYFHWEDYQHLQRIVGRDAGRVEQLGRFAIPFKANMTGGESRLSDVSLILYHSHLTRSMRVTWLCEELQIRDKLDIQVVALLKGEQNAKEFRQMNAMGAVPVLEVRLQRTDKGACVVTESGAIVTFLAELTGQMQPPNDNICGRAQYLRFISLAASSIDTLLWDIRLHEQLLPENLRNSKIASMARSNFKNKVIPTLVSALNGDSSRWICAPHYSEFSAADDMVGYSLFWASTYNLLDDSPVLTEYLARVTSRPAFAKELGTRQEIN